MDCGLMWTVSHVNLINWTYYDLVYRYLTCDKQTCLRSRNVHCLPIMVRFSLHYHIVRYHGRLRYVSPSITGKSLKSALYESLLLLVLSHEWIVLLAFCFIFVFLVCFFIYCYYFFGVLYSNTTSSCQVWFCGDFLTLVT